MLETIGAFLLKMVALIGIWGVFLVFIGAMCLLAFVMENADLDHGVGEGRDQ